MFRSYILWLILTVAIIFTSTVSLAQSADKQDEVIYLKNFQTGDRENFFKANGRITIAMVYQPDCTWCKKQGKTFEMLMAQCPEKVNLSLIGNKGTRRQLKRELKHFNKQLLAYQANNTFLRSIGGIEASPTTLFFDEHGQLLAKRRGYIEAQQFSAAVSQLTKHSCII